MTSYYSDVRRTTVKQPEISRGARLELRHSSRAVLSLTVIKPPINFKLSRMDVALHWTSSDL